VTLVERTIDPTDAGDRQAYLAGLRAGFGPEWGGEDRFDWAFSRTCGGPTADLTVLESSTGGQPLAGSAVTYRRLALVQDGEAVLVGIMTGSWTRPEAQGQGCFSQVIDWSQRVASARGASALLAFVTEANPSRRRLAAAGATEVASSYLASSPSTPAPDAAPAVVMVDDPGPVALAALSARPGAHRFAYPDVAAWSSQHLLRPDPVEVVAVAGAMAVVERGAASDRVLHVSEEESADPEGVLGGLLARAVTAGRQLFCFTTTPAWVTAGTALGMVAGSGSICVLPTGAVPGGPWVVHGGDRM